MSATEYENQNKDRTPPYVTTHRPGNGVMSKDIFAINALFDSRSKIVGGVSHGGLLDLIIHNHSLSFV